MSKGPSQLSLLKKEKLAFGGELMKTRAGRAGRRPLATRNTMHLVMRSSMAKGAWSMARPENRKKIDQIVRKFAAKYGVRIHSLANVGNHLHFHLQLTNLHTYKAFIRAISAAIAMAISGRSRWTAQGKTRLKFWDYRPFTRVIAGGLKAFLAVKEYIKINQLEGFGIGREVAKIILRKESSA